jgi:DNA-binding Lrp family transcriptional regulator
LENNYSYETSLPAYHEDKKVQSRLVYVAIYNGVNSLLAISEHLNLPQSTVAGRVNDLIEEGKVRYDGFTVYKNRKRKKILVNEKQLTFF